MTTVLATTNRTMNPQPRVMEILPRVANTQMGIHAMTVSQSVGKTTLLRKVSIVPDSQTGGPETFVARYPRRRTSPGSANLKIFSSLSGNGRIEVPMYIECHSTPALFFFEISRRCHNAAHTKPTHSNVI